MIQTIHHSMIKKHLMGFELAGLNKKENTILTVVWMIRI